MASSSAGITPDGDVGKSATGVKDSELEFLDQIITKQHAVYGEQIRLVCPIYVIPPTKPGKKKVKPLRRTLALGRYRLFLIRKSRLGGRTLTRQQPHLYELTHIISNSARILTLVFCWKNDKTRRPTPAASSSSTSSPNEGAGDGNLGGSGNGEPSATSAPIDDTHTLQLSSPGVPQIIKFLVEGLQEICQGFPPSLRVQIDVCPENWIAPSPARPSEEIVAGGIFETYRAQCSFFRSPLSPEFVRFVEEAIALENAELDLTRCPGLLAGSLSQMSVDLVPVCAALRANLHFRGLSFSQQLLDSGATKSLVLYVGGVLRHNTSLTRLRLRNLSSSSSSSHWEHLGQQLAQNPDHRLQVLDFSGSRLDSRALTSLLAALSAFPHGLRTLRLAGCGLSSRSLLGLFNLFERRYALSLTVEELDLSDNSGWNDEVSAAFERWLESTKGHSQLALLRLARGGGKINFARVAKPLRHLVNTLTCLDLSQNTALDFGAAQLIAVALENAAVLQRLSLARCKTLKPQSLEGILRAVLQNPQLRRLEINISSTGLSFKSVFLLAPLLHACLGRLHLLDLSGNKIDEKGLYTLFLAFTKQSTAAPPTLDTLLLDDCLSKPPKAPADLVDVIRQACASNPSLRALSLAGPAYGRLMPLFFERVVADPAVGLQELNIGRTDLGDLGAVQLAAALRHNRALLYLNVDGNAIGINGYHTLCTVLEPVPVPTDQVQINQSLCIFQWPWDDYIRLAGSLSDTQLGHLRQLLESIQRNLVARAGAAQRAWTIVPASAVPPTYSASTEPPPPIDVVPLADVPDFLKEIEQQTPFFEIGPDSTIELSQPTAEAQQHQHVDEELVVEEDS